MNHVCCYFTRSSSDLTDLKRQVRLHRYYLTITMT